MGKEIKEIDYKNLLLDLTNPRLLESIRRDQQSILDHIAKSTSIEELMEAIAENGYFPGEPLIVIPAEEESGKYSVVEGNRRLVAVKLLNDPNICSEPTAKMKAIAEGAKHKPEKLPIIICQSRSEVLPYLGFRHITGIKQWEPLAKARYIKQLYSLQNKELSPRERYAEVARIIGSRGHHIKRSLDALAVYKVIKDEEFFEIKGLNEESIKFAILSTAIADDRIGFFVGTHKKENEELISTDSIENPSSLKKENIKEFTRWLYEEDSKGKTKLGESRNLRQLSAVVNSNMALEAFRRGSSLKIAYQLTTDLTKDFIEYLYSAENSLTEASTMMATVEFQEDSQLLISRILQKAQAISDVLEKKKGRK